MNKTFLGMVAVLSLSAGCFAQEAACPLTILKVDPDVKQSWNRFGRALTNSEAERNHMNHTPDIQVKVSNVSGKDIRGLKMAAAWFDATEDLHVIPIAWNWTSPIKAGAENTLTWANELYKQETRIGWIVVPIKVLFEDGSKWSAPPRG